MLNHTLHALVWYGPAAMAVYGDEASSTIDANIKAFAQPAATITDPLGSITFAKATRLRNSPATLTGASEIVQALPKARARPTARIDVGANPSASDIAQAVWGSLTTINTNDGTMAKAMKLTAAVTANRVVTDPVAGTFTVYDDDNVTILASGSLWANAAGSVPYDGNGAERRDRLE